MRDRARHLTRCAPECAHQVRLTRTPILALWRLQVWARGARLATHSAVDLGCSGRAGTADIARLALATKFASTYREDALPVLAAVALALQDKTVRMRRRSDVDREAVAGGVLHVPVQGHITRVPTGVVTPAGAFRGGWAVSRWSQRQYDERLSSCAE